jgi:hypothetical protein
MVAELQNIPPVLLQVCSRLGEEITLVLVDGNQKLKGQACGFVCDEVALAQGNQDVFVRLDAIKAVL